MAKTAFKFSAARSAKKLPKDIKEVQSISTFQHTFYDHIVCNYYS